MTFQTVVTPLSPPRSSDSFVMELSGIQVGSQSPLKGMLSQFREDPITPPEPGGVNAQLFRCRNNEEFELNNQIQLRDLRALLHFCFFTKSQFGLKLLTGCCHIGMEFGKSPYKLSLD